MGFDGMEGGEGGAEADTLGRLRIGEQGVNDLQRVRCEGVVAIEDVLLVALMGGVVGGGEGLVAAGPVVDRRAVEVALASGAGNGLALEKKVEGLELDGSEGREWPLVLAAPGEIIWPIFVDNR